MNKLSIGIVSLGCDKNRLDSEIMIKSLDKDFKIVNDAKKADIIIVNTCGFIEESKQESINTILEMAEYKYNYKCKILIVTGCLSQRYKTEIMELMPEIDIMLGVNDYDKLKQSIYKFLEDKSKIIHCNYSDNNINEGDRILTTPNYTAYLRIAEGCSNYCTYCAIPYIRGKYRSRDMESIIEEANLLAKKGVNEVILVAQDTTKYGIDIYGKKQLHNLIKSISKIHGIKWIRILYCYPEEITEELIEEIKNNKKVCKYLDIPIQHISDRILKRMGRKSSKEDIISVVTKLKNQIKDICIRTSLIVGFPGETEEDFNELKDFVKEFEFGKLGVFKYSQEEGTAAANMSNQISDDIKELRQKEIMILQQNISAKINKGNIGKIYEVLVEGKNQDVWYGRNYEMAPEIDGAIYFKCDKILNVGEILKVKIINALEYDLIGVVEDESCK
ncbi:ribosomal protein S12 methylthiotransferase RimO [Clostridium acetireducens DSM 10703]|uniref:Ribosomal protein uS12 methylthiotransferase RimO n=1 Tax=Clostridium acetireducens DSM 10703 TaxID=1121290 RepID=A0A1E8F2H5_9CLOT|nr:30S ribosomal protein S12 methylthiotransferase RimO [Clostridium acetireducens]OFI07741.1 ribosomal protein S12 methylthiotransferase RimO [Clostridium acetireducens DSM 10703]